MGWCSVATSSSGQYIGAANQGTAVDGPGTVYISSNFGSTWSQVTSLPTNSWSSITLSSTGQNLVVVGGGSVLTGGLSSSYVYTSSNYGAMWTQTGILASWTGVACDSTGSMIFATSSLGCYISMDFGQTWSLSSQSVNSYIASSGSGQYLLSGSGVLYVSSDYGATWFTSGPSSAWYGVAMSTSGQYMYASQPAAGYIFISSNHGSSFVATQSPFKPWTGVTTDSSGQFLAGSTCCVDGSVFISSDYGQTFLTTTVPASSYLSIASSGSFSLLVAAAVPGLQKYLPYKNN